MVTIESLEVRFEVEGEGDEAVFARLFEQHIRRWLRDYEDDRRRRRQAEADRSLGARRPAEETD